MEKEKKSFIEILSGFGFLNSAWRDLNKSNKKSRGLSGQTIYNFALSRRRNLQDISKQLLTGKYYFSPLRATGIDKGNGDLRPLRIPEIRDRVVLKALCNILRPELEKKYSLSNEASFAYLNDKGIEKAWERVFMLYRKKKKWALKSDIIQFFDAIDPALLLREYVYPALQDDSSINRIIYDGLKQEIGNFNKLSDREKKKFKQQSGGIPQGSPLSPLLSNTYLARFDSYMLNKGYGLTRYADDFVVMCESRAEAEQAYHDARIYLKNELNLELHEIGNEKTSIVDIENDTLTFLSVTFNGIHTWPSQENFDKLILKIKEKTDPANFKDVYSLLKNTRNLIHGWIEAFQFTTTIDKDFQKIDAYVNHRIAEGVKKVGWHIMGLKERKGRYYLSNTQRQRSGILTCKQILDDIKKRKIARIDDGVSTGIIKKVNYDEASPESNF